MQNPLQGIASFTFGGREWHLKLDNRALYYAEDVLGYSSLDAVNQVRADLTAGKTPLMKTIVALVYGGLKQNHPDIDEDTVLEMFLSEDPIVRDAVMKAMRGTQMPDTAPPGTAGNGSKKARGARKTR
ncbi:MULTISPECIES: hypothetical protein [Sphingomonadales]|jgi:hypothetical protein|uniref:hypothetical protein n=1 Tax=Sphingomonadales TaxID=204457 RepID=UPI000823FBA9|nr:MULTISPECIES: hypothetical protein [Sphingomonadales]